MFIARRVCRTVEDQLVRQREKRADEVGGGVKSCRKPEQLFLTGVVTNITRRRNHQRDRLTGRISGMKHSAENPKCLTSISLAALRGTAEGGEHLFLHLLLQTGGDSRDKKSPEAGL